MGFGRGTTGADTGGESWGNKNKNPTSFRSFFVSDLSFPIKRDVDPFRTYDRSPFFDSFHPLSLFFFKPLSS